MLPLYKEAQSFSTAVPDAHRGLWWTRFFGGYLSDFCKPETPQDKKTFGENKTAFITKFKGACGDDFALGLAAKRNEALVDALKGEVRQFQTQGRFATGMGNDHPTENGFTWHHTLGVPYLPASSVKGLVRGWIEWNGDNHPHHARLKDWFGSQTKSEVSEQAGWFIFFDALPVESVQLAADVMTPHYDKWYEDGGKADKDPTASNTVPADWHSPVPVTFLTVKQATFQFGVAIRAGLSETAPAAARNDLPSVMAVLQEALEWAGAGAKTAVGYGRMSPPSEREQSFKASKSDWQECTVKYNAGKGLLSIVMAGKVIESRREDTARWMMDVPEENKSRWKKDKPVKAWVIVETQGNAQKIIDFKWSA